MEKIILSYMGKDSFLVEFVLFWLHTVLEGTLRNHQTHEQEQDSRQMVSWLKACG